jgi:hypothetical protein
VVSSTDVDATTVVVGVPVSVTAVANGTD